MVLHDAPHRLISSLADRSAARRRQAELERELSHYRSEADVRELEAILERHTPEQAAPVRTILERQRRSTYAA